jgi:mono/diheme cytochrome c family protein/ketosteroid isomerase-like protein
MWRFLAAATALTTFSVYVGLSAQERAWPVPDSARVMKNPIAATPDAITAGAKVYEVNCARCHGPKGAGDGPGAKAIKPAPPDLTGREAQSRPDGELFYKITEGKRPMPPMKSALTDEQRWQLVHFVRTLRPGATTVAAAAIDKPLEAQQVVESWFTRWNALDGTPGATEALVQLYEADALHSTGPASHQLGTVTYSGHEGIRKMVAAFTEAHEAPRFRIEAVTANEQTAHLFNTVAGPWGGPSIAVEYAAAYTAKIDGKRYYYPGAAFFQIRNGKIRRLRVYMASGELAEVEPDVVPRRRP